MYYDPVKRTLGNWFGLSPSLRKFFYCLLDLLLLRAWHIHKEINCLSPTLSKGNGVNILDAGAGFGQYTYYLTRKFSEAKILAVDIKQEQVADCNNFFHAIGKKNVRFETADLTRFVQENRFNLVISVDVMEHISEDVLVFRNIFLSLSQEGVLLISTPSDQGGSDASEHHGASFIEEHVRNGYNKKEIEDKLYSVGFSKVKVRYAYGLPGKISWHLSMKFPLILLGISKLFFVVLPFYYLLTYPFSLILNYIDTHSTHQTGTGLIVKAYK